MKKVFNRIVLQKYFFTLVVSMLLINAIGCKNNNAILEKESGLDDSVNKNLITENFIDKDIIESKDDDIAAESIMELTSFITSNPIDNAFATFMEEQQINFTENTVLAYLYALNWRNEYESINDRLDRTAQESSWYLYRHNKTLEETAIEYAKTWAVSKEASAQFEEMANFYKLLVYDSLTRLSNQNINMDIQTSEEKLYSYLKKVNYTTYIPDDFFEFARLRYESSDKSYPMPLYAHLPEDDVYLFFAPPFGVVLSVSGKTRFFPWFNGTLSLQNIPPRLTLYECNTDGINKIAVILFRGSGTGLSVSELNIVNLDEDMTYTMVTHEKIEKILYHRLSAVYDPIEDIVTVMLDEQAVKVHASVSKEKSQELRGLDLGSIIYFNADNGILTTKIAIGVEGFDMMGPPFAYVDFYADIEVTKKSGISLSNCRIE